MSDGIWEGEYDARRYWSKKIEDFCKEQDKEIPDMKNKFASKLESTYLCMINHDK